MAPLQSPPGECAQTVATLRAEEEVDGVFACTRKERQISRAGTPYLTVELRDSTGSIVARAFRDADVLAGRFERGELVRVRGRVERFRGELQIEVRGIARARGREADPARFLPVAYRDIDELEGFLEHSRARSTTRPSGPCWRASSARAAARRDSPRALLGAERGRPRRAPPATGAAVGTSRLPRWPARAHGRGGEMALELCTLHQRLDRDLLLSAAIVHDLGKTREFAYGAEISAQRGGQAAGSHRARPAR